MSDEPQGQEGQPEELVISVGVEYVPNTGALDLNSSPAWTQNRLDIVAQALHEALHYVNYMRTQQQVQRAMAKRVQETQEQQQGVRPATEAERAAMEEGKLIDLSERFKGRSDETI